jgi:hypothetical protein
MQNALADETDETADDTAQDSSPQIEISEVQYEDVNAPAQPTPTPTNETGEQSKDDGPGY